MAKKEQNRASDRKYHYTYLIKDNIHNKFYYGVHSTDFDPEDINQYHSSSKHLKLMINSFGIDNFTKFVRRYFSSRVQADKWEHNVLRRMKVRSRVDFYNQSEGGVGYVTSGYVVVRCLHTGKILRVPCDDPYMNILYESITKGRRLPEAQKRALSELYKGKWLGMDNPVHGLKNSDDWVRTISERSGGRKLSEIQIGNLKDYSQWKHLVNYSNTKEVQDRINFHRSINNTKYANIYLYKGEVYLHKHELPVNIKVKSIEILPERHPLVSVLSARGELYPDIKTAAKSLGVVSGTLANRIKSDHPYWQDHYFLPDEVISSSKTLSEKEFRIYMRQKYKATLEEQKEYVKPFSVGASDEDLSKVFMGTGKFLKGTTFSRINEKDNFGCYSSFQVDCPICSKDFYVTLGICNGVFRSSYGSLKAGNRPCRCGDPKTFPQELYLYHVKQVCEKEGLEFLGLNGEWVGKKESKIIWVCVKGNKHSTSRVGTFLEKGSRCKCCRPEHTKSPPEKVNIPLQLKTRYLEELKLGSTLDNTTLTL